MGNIIVCKVGAESVLLDVDSKTQKDGERNRELWRAETYEYKPGIVQNFIYKKQS